MLKIKIKPLFCDAHAGPSFDDMTVPQVPRPYWLTLYMLIFSKPWRTVSTAHLMFTVLTSSASENHASPKQILWEVSSGLYSPQFGSNKTLFDSDYRLLSIISVDSPLTFSFSNPFYLKSPNESKENTQFTDPKWTGLKSKRCPGPVFTPHIIP